MTEVAEDKVTKPDYKIRLSEKYAIDTDKLNIILRERYEKRTDKGKFADLSGEIGWRDLGYFRTLDHLAEWLVKHEMFTDEGVSELKHLGESIERLKEEIASVLKEKVEVNIE